MQLKYLGAVAMLAVLSGGLLAGEARAQFVSPATNSLHTGGAAASATARFPRLNSQGHEYVPGSGSLDLVRRSDAMIVLSPMVTETWLSPSGQVEVSSSGYGNPKYPLAPSGINQFDWLAECRYYGPPAVGSILRTIRVENP